MIEPSASLALYFPALGSNVSARHGDVHFREKYTFIY